MILDSTFNLVIAVLLIGAQWLMRPSVFFRVARIIFWSLMLGALFLSFYLAYQQYQLWQAHPLSQFLLPPYRGMGYFLSYASVNFFLPVAANLFFASMAMLALGFINKKSKRIFFEPAEPYLAGAAILLSGAAWPILFLALGAVAFAGSIMSLIRRKGSFSLCYFWIPITAFVILISKIATL